MPARAKTPRDATVFMPSPAVNGRRRRKRGPRSSRSNSHPPANSGTDTDVPAGDGTGRLATPPSQREIIVPSVATVGSILEHVRKPPADRLEVEARIASGGMGSIDVAVDRALDRRIAIKTLHPHLARTIRRCGCSSARRGSPVCSTIRTSCRSTTSASAEAVELFFAMKLVEGQTLAELIRALPRGALDTATLYALLDVFAKVCDALAFAHSRGVLHCDVKPANVMVGEFGQVFLMDWGIARLVAREASAGFGRACDAETGQARRHPASATDNSVIGTPGYMSPEQARGDRTAARRALRRLSARRDALRDPDAPAAVREPRSHRDACARRRRNIPEPAQGRRRGSRPARARTHRHARDGAIARVDRYPIGRRAEGGRRSLHARRRRVPAPHVRSGRGDRPRRRAR